MKKSAIVSFLFLLTCTVTAQQGFQFDKRDSKKVNIPFALINNLIFIPIHVNGVELNFLLDTGVEETILFSLEDKDTVSFYDVRKIKLIGLGKEDAIEGLMSSRNKLSLKGLTDNNHNVCIVLDQSFNFSSQIGIPVNGIIGYHFFKNNLVEINYNKKIITVYRNDDKVRRTLTDKYSAFDITFEKSKPYTIASLVVKDQPINAKLLIDSGNSDALWLFADRSDSIAIPENNFDDFLGRGFSGEIHGKRARIKKLEMDTFIFRDALVAFPDSTSLKNIDMINKRIGSIGGEVLKRFSVVFDYPNNKMYLKKNSLYNLPFNYNMSGIEIHHQGMIWVKEEMLLKTDKKNTGGTTVYENQSDAFLYKFELKPVYQVLSVRKDSPAEQSGIMKGDVFLSINGKSTYALTLQEINMILKSEEGRQITIEVERNSLRMKFKFKLKSIL